MRPCDGITVIDVTRYLPGRFSSLMLADLGATVITVEPPRISSAKSRAIGRDTGPRYLALNRNKKSITLALNSEEGRKIFHQLARRADVLLEGSRPGVAKRLRVDYDTIKNINPRMVYVSISSFGQEGPYQNLSSHDINLMGLSGLLQVRESSPVPTGVFWGDTVTALTATICILSALIHTRTSGAGQYIDLSMFDSLISCLNVKAMRQLLSGIPVPEEDDFASLIQPEEDDFASLTHPFYTAYRANDDRYITIAAVEPHFWERLCILMGRKDLVARQYDKGAAREEIFDFFRKSFAERTSDEWIAKLRDADIPCGPVNSIEEALGDPQVIYRDMITEVEHRVLGRIKQLGTPFKFSQTSRTPSPAAPIYGEHTFEILNSLGYSKESIEGFRKSGVIE